VKILIPNFKLINKALPIFFCARFNSKYFQVWNSSG